MAPSPWNQAKEDARVIALQESVWHGSRGVCQAASLALFGVVMLLLGALVVPEVIATLQDTYTVRTTIVGAVLYIIWAIHPIFMPKMKSAPAPHGPLISPPTKKDQLKIRSVWLIVNPAAGPGGMTTGQGPRIAETVARPLLESAGITVTTTLTEYEGHGYDLALKKSLESFDALAVVGGDGTIHEVLNGMLSRLDGKSLPIGVIPAGTGNSMLVDMAAIHDVVGDPVKAVQVIIDGFAPPVDLNRVTFGPHPVHQMAYSCNVIGYSVDQCIGAVNIDGWRSWLGNARYDVCMLWGIIKGRSETEAAVKLRIDGKLVADCVSNLSIQHTQHAGKGLRICPNSYWNDGVMDIMAFEDVRRAKLLQIFRLVKEGGAHPGLSTVIYEKGKDVELEFPTSEGLFNLDGQFKRFEGGKIRIECVKGAINFLCPRV